jgi:hypothetical protein
MWKRTIPTLCVALGSFFLVGCPDDGPAEEAGEAIDEAADDAGDALDDAADEVDDAVDDATDGQK